MKATTCLLILMSIGLLCSCSDDPSPIQKEYFYPVSKASLVRLEISNFTPILDEDQSRKWGYNIIKEYRNFEYLDESLVYSNDSIFNSKNTIGHLDSVFFYFSVDNATGRLKEFSLILDSPVYQQKGMFEREYLYSQRIEFKGKDIPCLNERDMVYNLDYQLLMQNCEIIYLHYPRGSNNDSLKITNYSDSTQIKIIIL